MPQITDIRVQKKRKERVSVFLDGEFWTGMSQACYLELGLEGGQELTRQQVQDVEARVVSDSALGYALNRIGYGMVSEAQLKEKLIEREYSEQIADAVIAQCRELALVDDPYYAELLAAGQKEKGMGRRRVEQKLREKGLPPTIVEQALADAFPEDPDSDLDLARRSLQMKYGTELLDRPTQNRALGLLARRGFNVGVSRSVVAEQSLSEDQEAELHGPAEARQELERKYGGAELDRDMRRKAYGFLSRRGYTRSVINRALAGVDE